MSVNFDDILNAPVAQIEAPKPKPVGSYMAAVQGMPNLREQSMKDGSTAKIVSFNLKMVSAREDVDQTSLADAGEISGWPPLKHDFFYSTPEGAFALKKFLEEILGCQGATLKEMLGDSPGKMCLVTLKHEPYVDRNSGEPRIATRVAGVAKL